MIWLEMAASISRALMKDPKVNLIYSKALIVIEMEEKSTKRTSKNC